ncbi:L-ascorbate metabolism protein UlaG (beta-lactamase superfamily) [Streptosporangium becharense]|uniref:L-ascorbate metabolism protein UlaG (Beta-lactamase superfamily) n=1 Tax=Streptosporangium becharense TaxID=1816182 RepID=A0A7W9MHG7_9ACTN|nr:MBL fold metallo-hydrolase [Streptosporangium becharense]MBB2912614.1 L-ascorbate metabolism protein UlaG (beta-lactamase superfamily) [Streptosporangium becharense]MBB5820556.1 L-ascorbate metabolism protein UlaG (beta-lactamase superfamily) [Streptosporangium becharense]
MSLPEDASVFFVGNATTLIRYNGFTLLTDPNFLHRGQRAHLGYGLNSRRRTDPAIGVEELPPLDAVVLSHMHGDHWDRVARKGLNKDTPIITTPHAARRLRHQGFGAAVGLRTWHDHELYRDGRTVKITSLPARHAPGGAQALLPPVMGSMLEFCGADGRVDLRIHLSGDTLMDHRCLSGIPRRFPDIDLGIVHLGGTRILGMLVTMDGEQGARWVNLINPRTVMPVHYDDYTVFTSSLDDFRRHVERVGWADRVRYVARGESLHLPTRHGADIFRTPEMGRPS